MTRLMAYTLAIYLNYILRDKDVCLVCILIIRNGSCKQDMYQRRTLYYVPMYAVGEFYLAEINAFCNKRDFSRLEGFVPAPLGEERCN